MTRRLSHPVCAAALLITTLGGCVTRARMCNATSECVAASACVAGRCERDGVSPAVNDTRRLLFEPADVAYVRRTEPRADGALPPILRLGRAADGDTMLLLRFAVPLPKEARVVEAYLLLERSDAVDADPEPIPLHAVRVVDPWSARAVSWATSPRLEDVRAPSTFVVPAGRSLVRVDVRALVLGWRAHDRRDQGLAILAERTSATGIAFVSAPPRLELYVK